MTYQKTKANQFFFWGQTKKNRIHNSFTEESQKEPMTFTDFNRNITMASSCKNGSIFLEDNGKVHHCGNIAGLTLSGQYETRDW
jgi:hypothetical protein